MLHGRQPVARARPGWLADLPDPNRMTEPKPRPPAGLPRARGPWRVAVSEASMRPAIEPGDWLLVDPTARRWPRRGSVVVIREPDSDILAIKRVAAGPGDRVDLDEGHLVLGAAV